MTKLELVKAVIAKYRRDENAYDGDVVNADEWYDKEPYRLEPGRYDDVLFNSYGIIVWQRDEEAYDGYHDGTIYVNGLSKEDFELLEYWNQSFTDPMTDLDERVRLIKEKRLKAFVSTEASGIEYLEKKEEEERERNRLEDERKRLEKVEREIREYEIDALIHNVFQTYPQVREMACSITDLDEKLRFYKERKWIAMIPALQKSLDKTLDVVGSRTPITKVWNISDLEIHPTNN